MTTSAPSAVLSATDIARLIPHHGSMCLLDQVHYYDAEQIKCKAVSHRSQSNPLREHGVLHAVCGVEYAAQAMAVHGAILAKQDASQPARGGRLASVRSVELSVSRLDDIEADLDIQATHVMGDSNSMVYAFSVDAGERNVLKGKATVILMPPTLDNVAI